MSHISRSHGTGYSDTNPTSVNHNREGPGNTNLASSFGRLGLGSHHHQRHRQKPLFDDSDNDGDDGSPRSPVSLATSASISSKRGRRRQSDFSSPTFRVQLTRGPQGFGFSIAGGTDQDPPAETMDPRFVYVARITSGGVADLDGRLRCVSRLFCVIYT